MKIRLYSILRYLFPKSCYRIQLEIMRVYEGLGVELYYERELDVENGMYCYRPKVRLHEANSKGMKKVTDTSEMYTRKEMRRMF